MATLSRPSWTHHRARVAALSRDRDPLDPELIEARRDMRAARTAVEIERALSQAPALTAAERERLASLVLGGAA